MKNGYNSRFLQSFLKNHHVQDDTVPDLIQIVSLPSQSQQMYSPSRNQQYPSIRSSKKSQPSIYNNFESIGTQNRNYISTNSMLMHIEQLQSKIQSLKQRIKTYQQKQDQYESVIAKINHNNKQLKQKIQQYQQSENKARQKYEVLDSQIKQMKLKEIALKTQQHSSSFGFDKAFIKTKEGGAEKKQIYQKIQSYLRKIVDQFGNALKTQLISRQVEEKIQLFITQLLSINSFTIQRMTKKSFVSKIPMKQQNDNSFMITQRDISPISKTSPRMTITSRPNLSINLSQRLRLQSQKQDINLTNRSQILNLSNLKRQNSNSIGRSRSKSQRRRKPIFKQTL